MYLASPESRPQFWRLTPCALGQTEKSGGCRLRCPALRVRYEWIANRRTELVELESHLLRRIRLGSRQTGNSATRFHRHKVCEHSSSFLGKCSLRSFRQIMPQHFQRNIGMARIRRNKTVDSTHFRESDELDGCPVSLVSAKVKRS